MLNETPALRTQNRDASATAANALLQSWVPHAARDYEAQRNYDFGAPADGFARPNVSTLSPYLRHRLITEDTVLRAVIARHSPAAAEKFISEILWRAYFKGWLELRPAVWHDYVAQRDAALANVAGNSGLASAYARAVEGRTGIDAFDAFAHELVATNYLHNHARMWFASMWIFTLKLPWVLGADFFLKHLIDGDAASNTCSWRWVGGLHTIGKTYLARADNIARYTQDRFAPRGLASDAPPLTESRSYPAGRAPDGDALPDGKYALLVHAEDCAPESLDLPRAPACVILIGVDDPRSPNLMAAAVHSFARDALADAGARAAAHWGCPVLRWTPDAGPLSAMMADQGVAQAAMPYVPMGSLHDALAPHLANVSVARIIREYDARSWPFATKGFFHLRQKTEKLVGELSGQADLFG